MTAETYNPHQLVTLRDINDGAESFVIHKATDLEWKLETAKLNRRELDTAQAKIGAITSEMTSESWYNSNTDKDEVLSKLEEILGVNPTATVSITATIEVFITAEVPLKELDSFDSDSLIHDSITVDASAWGSEVNVDDWNLQSSDWEEQS